MGRAWGSAADGATHASGTLRRMSAPRIHVAAPLRSGLELVLPTNAARHVQVLRLQPGAALTLFDGQGGEWTAAVLQMGRREVTATVLQARPRDCELRCAVTLALGMPANERMDTLIEKATELGAAAIQPLVCERSVLRIAGERAERKAAHWQAIAVAACEQSGRNRLPEIAAARPLSDWLTSLPRAADQSVHDPAASLASRPLHDTPVRLLLSLDPAAPALLSLLQPMRPSQVTLLSGPEGGLSADEQRSAVQHGFIPVSLGPRVLRAETAPLAALACIAALEGLL